MSSRPDAADEVFDPGLQPERTLLAWRRTCLSFGGAGFVAMRFTVETLGTFAVIAGLLGAGLAVLAYTLAAWGYRRTHISLNADGLLSRSGWPMLSAAAGAVTIGVLCAFFLVMHVNR